MPEIKVEDTMILNTVNNAWKRPLAKLDYKSVSLFKVLERIDGKAFWLKLLPQWKKMHDVFNVTLLELYYASTILGCKLLLPSSDLVEGEKKYEIEEVARSYYN